MNVSEMILCNMPKTGIDKPTFRDVKTQHLGIIYIRALLEFNESEPKL